MHRRFFLSLSVVTCLMGMALLIYWAGPDAKAGPFAPNAEPTWGPDLKVNPSPTAAAFVVENLSMAVNRVNPALLLAGYTTSQITNGSGYAFSTNSGLTWSGGEFTGPWPGNEPMNPAGDVRVAFDGRGVGYYSSNATGANSNAYFVLTTTNGTAWSTPVPVFQWDFSQNRVDSDLAADGRLSGPNAGRVYMTWRREGPNNPPDEGIQAVYSSDGGRTWSGENQVSDASHIYAEGPSMAVASDGSVYIAFQFTPDGDINNDPELVLNRSTDGGVTWGLGTDISGAPITKIGRVDFEGRELMLVGGPTCNLLHIHHHPYIAVSPSNPEVVYAVWNDGRWESPVDMCGTQGRPSDIAFSRSTNGGYTWTQPIRLNDDQQGNGVDQFQPAIAVKSDGTIGVTWYDRRYDPNHYHYDVAYTQSTDGGLTWSTNRRVTDISSDPDNVTDAKNVDDLGDRHDLVFGPDFAQAGWFDTRAGQHRSDYYSDHGVIQGATPTPSVTPCAINFSDVQTSDYFYQAVRYLYCEGAISGYADGTFRPYNYTTRGQVSKIVVLAEGWTIDTTGGPHFSDVPPSSAFYDYVETAFHHNVISGYADGTFRWGNNVTRAQLTKIVVLAQGWAIDTHGGPHFSDVPTSDPFYGFIETAFNHGIITGYADGTFKPGNSATRGQISKIVYDAVTAP